MTDFADRDFIAGSLFGLRAFGVDSLGRLRGPQQTRAIWTPGENEAECYRGDEAEAMQSALNQMYTTPAGLRTAVIVCDCKKCDRARWKAEPAPHPAKRIAPKNVASQPQPVEKPKHELASLACHCGYYAYFDGANDYMHTSAGGFSSLPWTATRWSAETSRPRVAGIIEGYGVCTVGSRGFRASKARIVALVLPTPETPSGQVRDMLIRRNYPDVPVYDNQLEATTAHALSVELLGDPTSDPDFWTRSAS